MSLGKGDTWLHTTENFSTRFIEPRVSSAQGWLWQLMNCCKGKRYRDDVDIQSCQVLPSIFRCFCALCVRKHLKACYFEWTKSCTTWDLWVPVRSGINYSWTGAELSSIDSVMCLNVFDSIVSSLRWWPWHLCSQWGDLGEGLIYLGILNASLRTTWKCNATHKGYPPNNEKLCATWVFYPKILGAQHYFGYSPRVPPNFPKQSQFLCLNDPGDSLPHWCKSWACLETHFKDKAKEWMVTVGSIRPDYPCVFSA